MSKSPDTPNILLPALGGVGIAIGAAIGLATMNYGNDRIEALEESFKKERSLSSEQSAQISALQSDIAGASVASEEQIALLQAQAKDQAEAAEVEIADLRKRLETALSQASALGQGDAPMQTAATAVETAPLGGNTFGLGREAMAEEIAAWDVDVLPDGRGLPIGSGDVWTGDEVFAEKCASCHGDFAEGRDAWPVLAGGFDTLADEDPVKTVGSYWPYLSTVWDYVHRSMPFGAAGTLTDDEVYAITAYILYSNDLVDDDFTLSNETFLDVEMYNADGFIVDDRPTTEYTIWSGEPCMSNCLSEPVAITRRASDVGVTPADDGSMVDSIMEKELAAL
ncbi:MAG: c-type cytochrome, partial [Boseongicola sp.]|nr:c-type cytochrome [Boseongicola sp.]